MGVDIDSVERAVLRRIDAARRRWPRFDHICRAYERYDGVHGTRLAAAIAYYSFFAAFATGVLVFAVVGTVLPETKGAGLSAVQDYLSANLPQLDATSLTSASQRIGLLALIGLVLAGVAWVETLRSSQRAIWCLEQHPGEFIIRWLVDLAVLIGLGVLLLVSLALSSGLRGVVTRLTSEVSAHSPPVVAGALNWTDTLLAAFVDFVLAGALLAGVPRLRMSFRRLYPSALLVVVGLAVLKVAGRFFITRTQHNPAYRDFAAAAAAVGLLIFMYFFNQIVLFAAALAATSERGTVRDLAAGPKPAPAKQAAQAEPARQAEPVEPAEPARQAEPVEPAEPAEAVEPVEQLHDPGCGDDASAPTGDSATNASFRPIKSE
jgi:membrane protein